MLLNPFVAMLHDTVHNRWHPIIFAEAPLPGPPSPDKPIRHRSKMHHTGGFPSLEEAVTGAEELKGRIADAQMALEPVIPWDGIGIPCVTAFFQQEGDKWRPVLL